MKYYLQMEGKTSGQTVNRYWPGFTYFHCAHLNVEGKVGQVHWTRCLKRYSQCEGQNNVLVITLMVSLMERRISPVCMILRNWFSVVAWSHTKTIDF